MFDYLATTPSTELLDEIIDAVVRRVERNAVAVAG